MPLITQEDAVRAETGYLLDGETDASTGFRPEYITLHSLAMHEALSTEYYSGTGSGTSGPNNTLSQSQGLATGTGEQYVVGVGTSSDGVNAHYAYAGDGEVVYVVLTGNRGETVDSRARAELASVNDDGFTLNWTSLPSVNVWTHWKAYGVEDR